MPRKRVAETPMGDAMFRFDGYTGRIIGLILWTAKMGRSFITNLFVLTSRASLNYKRKYL